MLGIGPPINKNQSWYVYLMTMEASIFSKCTFENFKQLHMATQSQQQVIWHEKHVGYQRKTQEAKLVELDHT